MLKTPNSKILSTAVPQPDICKAHSHHLSDISDILDGCLFMYPPNYGSIAGKSYLDPVDLHDDRFTCNAGGNKVS